VSPIEPTSKREYIVIIVVKTGPGFPLVQKGSHVVRDLGTPFVEIAPPKAGRIMAFDRRILRQDPAVQGEGGSGIMIWYK